MAQTLEEQINTVERALGERMIGHALTVVRLWLNELGEHQPYEGAFASIERRYKEVFRAWLGSDDEQTDEILNGLTGETYQLVDAVYADIRLKRGLSPDMHGFNPEHIDSVMQYFSNCLRIREEDYNWLHDALRDEARSAMGLVAMGSLVSNLRECFTIEGMMAVMDGMLSDRELVAEQCMAYLFTLLIHYDIRIDFFPGIQEAFIKALREVDEEGEHAFEVLCALVRSTNYKWSQMTEGDKELIENLPDELRTMLSLAGIEYDMPIISWMPQSEREYMIGLVHILPDTWLYDVIVAGDSHRESIIAVNYLSIGQMDQMWDHPQAAEQYLIKVLREGKGSPKDYINYGHCQMLKGDRIMAFENYKQARMMCKKRADFLSMFRPDRNALMAHGVPIEQIYLIEDQMLNADF